MLAIVIAILSIIVLRLQTRWKWTTIFWVSVVLGLVIDFGADLVVMLRR